MSTGSYHRPVMADEAVDFLVFRADGRYIDATAGGGSHTLHILSRLSSLGKVVALDRDEEAVAETQQRVQEHSTQVEVIHGEFGSLRELMSSAGIAKVSGVFFDLGVSSHQIDDAGRGFSYRQQGPLDLRMDRTTAVTAADVIAGRSEVELAELFYTFGGEKNSRKISAAIVEARRRGDIATTGQLAGVIASVTNPRYLNKTLSRCFQALRVVVNGEMDQLSRGLEDALELLETGGRLVVISYHSLEDRMVKNFIRDKAHLEVPQLRVLTKKPVTASAAEVRDNPRARSAKMRAAEKM